MSLTHRTKNERIKNEAYNEAYNEAISDACYKPHILSEPPETSIINMSLIYKRCLESPDDIASELARNSANIGRSDAAMSIAAQVVELRCISDQHRRQRGSGCRWRRSMRRSG